MKCCASWRADSDAAGCSAGNLDSRVDMASLLPLPCFRHAELGKELRQQGINLRGLFVLDPMGRSLKHFEVSIITVLKTFSGHCFTRELVAFSPNQERRHFHSRSFGIQRELRRTQ